MKDKIKQGTKFFINHGYETNSHNDRKPVGEIIASFLKDIEGKLSNVIIGHFPNPEEIRNEDICSMEAELDVTDSNVVSDVDGVTAIALGNSERETPGFSGARRLATVQCFGESNNINQNNPGEGGKKMEITFAQVKQFITERNVFPWQLFTEDDLKNDKTFGKIFEEKASLKAENEKLKEAKENLEKQSKDALRKANILDANKKLESMMEKGYTDKQKKYLLKHFDPNAQEDLSEDGLSKYLESGKKSFAEDAKFFGVTEEQSGSSGSENNSDNDGDLTAEEEALKELGV